MRVDFMVEYYKLDGTKATIAIELDGPHHFIVPSMKPS